MGKVLIIKGTNFLEAIDPYVEVTNDNISDVLAKIKAGNVSIKIIPTTPWLASSDLDVNLFDTNYNGIRFVSGTRKDGHIELNNQFGINIKGKSVTFPKEVTSISSNCTIKIKNYLMTITIDNKYTETLDCNTDGIKNIDPKSPVFYGTGGPTFFIP